MDGHPESSVFSLANGVELFECDGQWFVKIVENAIETLSTGFEREEFAVSFAEGQCMRVGIADFVRS